MKTEADFVLIDLPSGSVAILEKNSLQYWFEPNAETAQRVLDKWAGMEVTKPQMRLPMKFSGSVCFEATFACNLRCKYCFMADDDQFNGCSKHMSLDTAKSYLMKYAPPKEVGRLSPSFLGGEPTMNMDLICRLKDWADKAYKRTSFGVTTNGTLLTRPLREMVTFKLNEALGDISVGEWMARHRFGVTLSFDGPEAVHDEYRVKPDGSGSFAAVMESLQFLKERSPDWVKRFTFRATYGDSLEVSLLERLQFFNGLIDEGMGGNVHMEPATLKPETLPIVEQQHHEMTEWFIQEVKAGRVPKWSDLTKTLRKLVLRQPSVKNCGAGVNYMTCGIDGEIYACHRTFGAKVGSLSNGIDTEAAAEWEDNRVYAIPDCATCEIKYICGGACRAANYAEHGSTRTPSTTNCFVRKLRVSCSLRIIEALTAEDLERIFPTAKQHACKNSE